MLSLLKSRFDDSEYGSLYRYTREWVAYGNPAKAYTQLIYLLQGFTDLCNQHGIEYWLDWGSLLGYLRHDGGVIPWDYDHDVGMVTEMYEKFIAIIEKMTKEQESTKNAASSSSSSSSINTNCTFVLSDFTFERQGERGYYVMSLASHPEIQIDIVEYLTVNDATNTSAEPILKHNMDDVTYEGFFYPDMPYSMVFPLKKVNMLGCASVMIPADSDAVTKLHFGSEYMKVLWVPYLLTKLYNPFLTNTLWLPPIREIPILQSYIEGLSKYGNNSPFLVRKPREFSHITEASLLKYASTCTKTVFGYDSAGEIVEGLVVKDIAQQWRDDKLKLKVLDSPLECCELPQDFVAMDKEVKGSETTTDASSSSNRNTANAGLGLMLTRANSYTFLHLDPPMYGGGWMYLVSGRKSWTYIAPEFIELLYDTKTKRLVDLPVSELTTRFGYRLHGKVMHVTAEAGDLVYFPPAWMHRVRTYEKALGVSGYMKVEKAHEQMRKYTEVLEKKGLNSIWNGNDEI